MARDELCDKIEKGLLAAWRADTSTWPRVVVMEKFEPISIFGFAIQIEPRRWDIPALRTCTRCHKALEPEELVIITERHEPDIRVHRCCLANEELEALERWEASQ
jgi:hypothetical protein